MVRTSRVSIHKLDCLEQKQTTNKGEEKQRKADEWPLRNSDLRTLQFIDTSHTLLSLRGTGPTFTQREMAREEEAANQSPHGDNIASECKSIAHAVPIAFVAGKE